MNKRQKELFQYQLDGEKKVLRKLEKVYSEALTDINTKLELLMARQDADMQHVIYQVEHQKALKTQVQSILENLQTKEFDTLSKYLTDAYEDGFIGSMYDMHGQGVPLILPINQSQVVAAIQHETKLSENLYTHLGKSTTELKKKIASEISRGISSGLGYPEIARNIRMQARIPLNNAMTIARTESHRIQIKGTADAQHRAKKKGADVVKQWDASLDGDTRKSHRKLDGQIRELDEDFEVDGKKVKYPGGFGKPEEDCNCRCGLLQRARWALDESELDTLKERAEYFGLDKTKDFEDFKQKYLKALKTQETLENTGKSGIIKEKKDLSKYIGKPLADTDNLSVREWYYANVHDIPNQLDKSKPFDYQVKQAFELRNKYKKEARIGMSDVESVERLEKKRPIKTFEELLQDKMKRKNLSKEEALKDILATASKTNKDVDKDFLL